MPSVNRFIQFNNEMIDARQLIHYENIAKAMTKNLGITVNERKLIEFQPEEKKISISVFWRHRNEEVMHNGRLSDIYLLTEGFWKYFSTRALSSYLEDRDSNLHKLMDQLIFCLEEFRLIEHILQKRIGLRKIFNTRVDTYLSFHKQQMNVNLQKGFLADAFISYLYVSLYEGTLHAKGPDFFLETNSRIQRAYDYKSTNDSIDLAYQLVSYLEDYIKEDSILQFFAILSPSTIKNVDFHYHSGVKESLMGSEDKKDTIEEVFRSWHRENEQEDGVHLQYELEHGRDGKIEKNMNSEEGREGHAITETGKGQSSGNRKESMLSNEEDINLGIRKKAGNDFGNENLNVVFEEKRIETIFNSHSKLHLQAIRQEQAPYVKAFVHEMKKRMEQKKIDKRTNLSKGRLSTQLTTLWTEERPKPFYKKDAPSTKLNAVFGLLVDGSASMQDKMEETQKAVLLFHDVLRELNIVHEIVLHYEDAYEATETNQPNTFEWVHRLEDGQRDSGPNILAMEAHEDNRDGFAIRWIGKRLEARQEIHKFLLVFSDGEPSAFGYAQNGIMDTAEAVLEVERKQISILHLFLNDEEPTEEQINLFQLIFGKNTATASSLEKFSDETLRLLRKMLQHVVKS